jgi:hypothetical protein
VHQLYISILIRVVIAASNSIGIVLILSKEYHLPLILSLALIAVLFIGMSLLLKVLNIDLLKKMFIQRETNV